MPQTRQFSRSYLYTVRIWPEELEEDRWEWRGKVTFITSGEETYFRDWETLVEIIQRDLPHLTFSSE